MGDLVYDIIMQNRVNRFWMRCKDYGLDKTMQEQMFRHVLNLAKRGECVLIDINGFKVNEINTVIGVYSEIIQKLHLEHQVIIHVTEIPKYSDQDSLYAKKATDHALANIENQYNNGRKLLN